MVKLSLDTDKLMRLIRGRAEFSHMAYPNMTEAEEDALIERLLSDPSFNDMVAECALIDDADDIGINPLSI